MSLKELNKVRLGSSSLLVNEDEAKSRDPESEVSEDDDPDAAYEVDFIKYAIFRTDIKKKTGWYYCIVCNNYLKSKSDCEESKDAFNDNDDPDGDIARFWRAAGRKLRIGTKEPKGKPGEVVEAPDAYLTARFAEINKDGPVRSLTLFKKRRRRELKGEEIRKKDSDHYQPYNQQRRRARLLQNAAKKRKRVVDSDDENGEDDTPGGSAGPSKPASALSPDADLNLLDPEDDEGSEDDVPLAKKSRPASATQIGPSQADTDAEAKRLRKEKKRAERKAEAERKAQVEEAERLEEVERKRRKKERKERLAREAAKEAKQEKEEAERVAAEKKKAAAREASWGTFSKKRKGASTSSPAVTSALNSPSVAHTTIPTPPASASASFSNRTAPPLKSTSASASASTSRPPMPSRTSSSDAAHFGEPSPGIFDHPSSATAMMRVGSQASSGGSLFAADGESLAPDEPGGKTARAAAKLSDTAAPLSSQTVVNSAVPTLPQSTATLAADTSAPTPTAPGAGPPPALAATAVDPRKARKAAAVAQKAAEVAAAAEPSVSTASDATTATAEVPGVPPPPPPQRAPSPPRPPPVPPPAPLQTKPVKASTPPKGKPIVIDVDRPPWKPEPKIKVLEMEPNKVLGRFGLGGSIRPPSPTSAPPPLPPTPVSGSSSVQLPTGPRVRPPIRPQANQSIHPTPVAVPLYAHTSGYVPQIQQARPPFPLSGAGPNQGYRPAQMQMPQVTGGVSPIAPSPNSYGGTSPAYPQAAPGASPHWQPNQPLPPQTSQTTYNLAADPRRARRGMNGGQTPDRAPNQPTTPATSSLPVVPENQPLPTGPSSMMSQPRPGITKVSSYQLRRPSIDESSATLPAKPAAGPSDVWTAGQGRHVIGTGVLLLPFKQDSDVAIAVRLVNGSSISPPAGDVSLGEICARSPRDPRRGKEEIQFRAETLDAYCLHSYLQKGAKIIEWAKVAYADEGSKRDWDNAKAHFEKGKIFVAYTDSNSVHISRHYAVVFAAGKQVDFAALNIGYASWSRNEIDCAAFLVSLPIDIAQVPALPNPVRPLFDQEVSKPILPEEKPVTAAESYGVHASFFQGLAGKHAQLRFSASKPTALEHVHQIMLTGFKTNGVIPQSEAEGRRAEAIVTENSRSWYTLRSTTISGALPRRTEFYAIGTSLSLLPHDWKLRTIWSTGGLVTFSPTFMLRSPNKFTEIMQMLRPTTNWAAYVLPGVIEYCNTAWDEPQKCPDSTNAFAALTRSLFLDEQLLRFSGSTASSGGGLAISTCPPSVHQTEACMSWVAWLKLVFDQRDFDKLVDVCKGVTPGDWASFASAVANSSPTLAAKGRANGGAQGRMMDLIDVEKSQIQDLVDMRTRNELLPYRRYLYVGEMSLDSGSRDRYGRTVEFVKADDFVAVFSGAV